MNSLDFMDNIWIRGGHRPCESCSFARRQIV